MNIFEDIIESVTNSIKEAFTSYDKSDKWLEYLLGPTLTHCLTCAERNCKIYGESDAPELPEHPKCACYLSPLRSLKAGTATERGIDGADYYLLYFGKLPDYYITKSEAKALGWVSWKGNLDKVAPGKMIGGDDFKSKENLLPSAPGRIWYECDIDYESGYRNNYRLVYSNDGLVFKTDIHYKRFIEIRR